MELMTKEIEEKLTATPLHSTDGQGTDAELIVKYFNPVGRGTWLITEGEKQLNGDWLLFGYMHIYEWEWGYVYLSELQGIKLPFGMQIERDLHASGKVGDQI